LVVFAYIKSIGAVRVFGNQNKPANIHKRQFCTMASINTTAKQLKALHKPGNPILFTNVYDRLTAEAVASVPSSKALATASYAVARAAGTQDDDMTLEINLAAIRGIADVAQWHDKPLSVDIQDGYGERLEEAISALIKLGVVGVNLEDCDKATQKMYAPEVAAERVKRVLAVAGREGVPDFVVNARCDTLVHGGELAEVLERGNLYLEAGATTVFVWGGSKRGTSRAEVVEMVKAFDGRLNVSMRLAPGNLTVKELAEIGVARISIGPDLQFAAMEYFGKEAAKILGQT
jgi:2-methylisocitrate lyase-like PEP mutase family enzyme